MYIPVAVALLALSGAYSLLLLIGHLTARRDHGLAGSVDARDPVSED